MSLSKYFHFLNKHHARCWSWKMDKLQMVLPFKELTILSGEQTYKGIIAVQCGITESLQTLKVMLKIVTLSEVEWDPKTPQL